MLFEIFKGEPLPGHHLCLHEIEKSLLSRIFYVFDSLPG